MPVSSSDDPPDPPAAAAPHGTPPPPILDMAVTSVLSSSSSSSSQDIRTANSSTTSLDLASPSSTTTPHTPYYSRTHPPPLLQLQLQRQVFTYQLPVRMNGGKIVYITKTYTRPPIIAGRSVSQAEVLPPPKRPLMKRIIRFIKYGPVD